jgi:xylulokinase
VSTTRDTVLGIDLGTQSLKAVFYDYASRQVVAAASSGLVVERDQSGRAEQRAVWWTDALRKCLGQVPSDVRSSVQAIGVSGQQHGFVAVDGKGEVLIPVKLWCDTSTQTEVDEITAAAGGREQCSRIAGNPVLAGYTAPKVLWFRKHHPQLYRQMACILLPHDYINYVMTGVACMEFGDASGTGFLDIRRRRWSAELLRAIDAGRDLTECLPPLVEANASIGVTTAEFSKDFGLPAGVPVSSGGGDNMMGAIGTGNVRPGKLTMSLGSSGTLYACSDSAVVDPEGNVAAFCSSTGGWLPLICTMNCTLGTDLVRGALDIDIGHFNDTVSAVPAGSGGLIVLPFFHGERTPDLPNANGSVLGIHSGNFRKGHILRATAEGATYALRYGLDEFGRLGIRATEIVLTGGGAKSAAWRQMVADVFNLPVTVLQQEEGASFGAALQALWMLQSQTDAALGIDDIVAEHLTCDEQQSAAPVSRNVAAYEQGYAAYQSAVQHISPLYAKHTDTL